MPEYRYRGTQFFPTVEIDHDVIPYLGGITEGEFYRDTEKCIHAWKEANRQITDYFGDLLQPNTPSAPPLAYGHLVSLGLPLRQPEDAEPNVQPYVDSIEDAIAFLEERRTIDFGDNPTCRHYIELNTAIGEAFPGIHVAPLTGFNVQGVITSAVLLRGSDFFCDLYDDPELAHRFLSLLNESIINFKKFQNRTNGFPEVTPFTAKLFDDFASLVPPDMWPEFVVPYWKQYYEELSTAQTRFLHYENAHPAQLRCLKELGITHYQPSVSDALTIENVRENTDVPFDWLLYAFRITEMTDAEIEAWADTAVGAEVEIIRTQFGKYAWSSGKMDRILAFYKAFEKYRA
ncbi:MAG: hypothetical protein E7632_00095 [Ruminococcaceae bacterium]|nr:hypothetical protein [Oscillospiraceae bacterium]